MKKIFILLLLIPSLIKAQQNIVTNQQTGISVTYGLNTATKPVNPLDNSYFIETNTGNIYLASGGVWTLPTNTKTVRAVTDFPTPVSGVITLADNVAYIISGTVDIGTNTIVCGTNSSFIGINRSLDILTCTGSGTMVTVGSGKKLRAVNLTLGCPNGTMFSVTSSSLSLIETVINPTSTMGTITTPTSFTIRNCIFTNAVTTAGFSFVGTSSGDFTAFENVLNNNAGTLFAFGTSIWHLIYISRNPIICNTGQTIISGTTGGSVVTIR